MLNIVGSVLSFFNLCHWSVEDKSLDLQTFGNTVENAFKLASYDVFANVEYISSLKQLFSLCGLNYTSRELITLGTFLYYLKSEEPCEFDSSFE